MKDGGDDIDPMLVLIRISKNAEEAITFDNDDDFGDDDEDDEIAAADNEMIMANMMMISMVTKWSNVSFDLDLQNRGRLADGRVEETGGESPLVRYNQAHNCAIFLCYLSGEI